jgi:hypothetical protein
MLSILKFITILFISLLVVFVLHIAVLHFKELPLFHDKIIAAYLVNFLMATGIYIGLFFFRKKYSEQLGFLYLGGSFIKFILFFIFFYPYYKADGQLTTSEFMAFFIPYAISLIFETLGVIKFLKK